MLLVLPILTTTSSFQIFVVVVVVVVGLCTGTSPRWVVGCVKQATAYLWCAQVYLVLLIASFAMRDLA